MGSSLEVDGEAEAAAAMLGRCLFFFRGVPRAAAWSLRQSRGCRVEAPLGAWDVRGRGAGLGGACDMRGRAAAAASPGLEDGGREAAKGAGLAAEVRGRADRRGESTAGWSLCLISPKSPETKPRRSRRPNVAAGGSKEEQCYLL